MWLCRRRPPRPGWIRMTPAASPRILGFLLRPPIDTIKRVVSCPLKPRHRSQFSSKIVNTHPPQLGSFGMMIVGLGGANGTVLLAGILANRLKVDWHGARGEPMSPNYYGCITQLDQKGGGVGYRDKVKGLANASSKSMVKRRFFSADVATGFLIL